MGSYLFVMLILSALFVVFDMLFKTKLINNIKFWIMQLFVVIMVVAFDIFAHGTIWKFNELATSGIYIINTPLENIIFGFSLIGISLVLFERDIRKK